MENEKTTAEPENSYAFAEELSELLFLDSRRYDNVIREDY